VYNKRCFIEVPVKDTVNFKHNIYWTLAAKGLDWYRTAFIQWI